MFCFVTALAFCLVLSQRYAILGSQPSTACYNHSPTFSGAQTGWRPGTRRTSHSAHFHVEKPSLVNSDSYVSIVTTVWLARKVFSCGLSISGPGHQFKRSHTNIWQYLVSFLFKNFKKHTARCRSRTGAGIGNARHTHEQRSAVSYSVEALIAATDPIARGLLLCNFMLVSVLPLFPCSLALPSLLPGPPLTRFSKISNFPRLRV